jgi:hypothetical protein
VGLVDYEFDNIAGEFFVIAYMLVELLTECHFRSNEPHTIIFIPQILSTK